jgi:pyridoxamine 5'-phosphate oxidase family protein
VCGPATEFGARFKPSATRRHDNVATGHTKVALVIDDLAATQPWAPRFVRIYGTAEVIEGGNLRITPTISWSWNLDGQPLTQGQPSATPPNRAPLRPICGHCWPR